MMKNPISSLLLVFVAAGVPFYFGVVFGVQRALQRFAFETGVFFLIMAILAIPIVITLNDEHKLVRIVGYICMGMFLCVLFTAIMFVHDRQENLPEDFCQDLNDAWSAEQEVALQRGMCAKNETGFHATGNAFFPDKMFPIIDY